MITLPPGFNIDLFVSENVAVITGMISVAVIFLVVKIVLKFINYGKFAS